MVESTLLIQHVRSWAHSQFNPWGLHWCHLLVLSFIPFPLTTLSMWTECTHTLTSHDLCPDGFICSECKLDRGQVRTVMQPHSDLTQLILWSYVDSGTVALLKRGQVLEQVLAKRFNCRCSQQWKNEHLSPEGCIWVVHHSIHYTLHPYWQQSLNVCICIEQFI